MQPETRFKMKIKAHLNEIPNSWWFKVQMVALRGIPDVIGVVNGRFVALELKTDTNNASTLQGHIIDKIAKCGGYAKIARPSNMWEILDELKKL